MRNKFNSLWLLLFFLVPLMAFGQDSVLVISSLHPSGRLNAVIAADTLVSPSWKAGTRVYALQKGGIFPFNAQVQIGGSRKLKMRAAYDNEIEPVFGSNYDPQIWGYDVVGTTGRPPGTIFIFGGPNTEFNLKHISISAFQEDNAGEVDGVQGNLINSIAAAGNGTCRLIMDSCLLKSSNGNHIRADGQMQTIRITNTLFADMGNNATSNFGAGKGFDIRANRIDTFDVRNCTFVNAQDRIIRHYQSTAPILNLTFNNNTVVNCMGYHSTMSLGRIDSTGLAQAGTQKIKNNMWIDAFSLGKDTAVVRQAEFNDDDALDPVNGAPEMAWILAASTSSNSADWDISGNYYAVSDSGRVMFNMPLPKGPYYRSEGNPLSAKIQSHVAPDAFQQIGIKPANAPELMERMIRWVYRPRSEGGAQKGKGGNNDPLYTKIADGNWTFDYNRKGIYYYLDTLNLNYTASITLPAGIGDQRWSQTGVFPYTLNASATGGTVTKYPNYATYAANGIVTITATPNAGQVFTGWSGDATGSANPLTISMNASKNIVANFSSGTTYTLATVSSPGTSGSVNKNPDLAVYTAGSSVILTASPSVGKSFKNWTGDAAGSTNPLTVTMDANKSITAVFSADSFQVNVSATNGAITKSPNASWYQAGTVVTLTAQPTDGNAYHFAGWSGDPQVLGIQNLVNPVPVYVVNTMNITANFEAGASAQVNLFYENANTGAVTKAPNITWFSPNGNSGSGDIVALTARTSATPTYVPTGYEFKRWTGDTTGKTAATSPASFFMTTTRNITAVFGLKQYALTTVNVPTGGGSITKNPNATAYDSNTVVTVTAAVNGNYIFDNWTGAATGTTNPTTVTMTGAKAVTANYHLGIVTNDIAMAQGWNLVSVPTAQADYAAPVVFPGAFGDMFKFENGGYATANPLAPAVGYWAYYTAAATASVSGTVRPATTISLAAGWNLVGSREVTINTSALTTAPAGQLFGDIFAYANGGYTTTITIAPGQGVWVYSLTACNLTLP